MSIINTNDPPTLSRSSTRVSVEDDTRRSPTMELHGHDRRPSETSLHDTMSFYGVGGEGGAAGGGAGHRRRASQEEQRAASVLARSGSAQGRASPAPVPGTSVLGRPTISYQNRPNQPTGILPSASFFNPKRPARLSTAPSAVGGATSPAPSALSNNSRYSTQGGLEPMEGVRRTPNGPLITRVSTDYANTGEKVYSRRFSSDGSESPAAMGPITGAGSPRSPALAPIISRPSSGVYGDSADAARTRTASATASADESTDHGHDASLDEAGGSSTPGRNAFASKTSREHLLDFPSAAAKDANSSSPTIPRSPPRHGHSRSISDELKITSRLSVEGAVQRARLSFTSMARSGSGDTATGKPPPGSQQLPDVPSSGEYERDSADNPARARQQREAAAGATPAKSSGAQLVQIPHEPVVDEKGRRMRNYQLHPGTNRFFFGGHLVSSKDNPTPFIVSLVLAILLPAAFFAFTGPYLWNHLGGGGKASIFVFAYLAAIMITSMCRTAWTDPGIIPRGLDRVPERKWVEDLGEGEGGWKAEPKYMRIKEGVVASKWCETCGTYRPPRTSHCRLCDNCVDHTDHHCTFLNTCIGRRNYTSFFAFLVSSILCCLYAVAFSAWHISSRHSEDPSNWTSHWDVIGSFVVCVLSFGLLLPIFGLFGYHMRLLYTNRTTIEMLRPKTDRSGAINPANGEAMGNLYALSSPFANIVSLLCRPMEVPSWIAPHRYAERDRREEEGAGAKEDV